MTLAVMTGTEDGVVFEILGEYEGVEGMDEEVDTSGKKYGESEVELEGVDNDDVDECTGGKLAGFWICGFGTRPDDDGVRGAMKLEQKAAKFFFFKEEGPEQPKIKLKIVRLV